MPGDADNSAAGACSSKTGPGDTTAPCPLKKVLTLTWDNHETWCSEDGPISGTTTHYSDGEKLSIAVTNPGTPVTTLSASVTGDAFHSPWKVLDVLPVGGPSWQPRRPLEGETSGVKTPDLMDLRFIPNVTRAKKDHTCNYNRTDPGATAPKQVGVECRFELEVANYLLTVYGQIKYVRGIGRERLQLGDATLTGGFTLFGATQHWGYQDPASGGFKYWDGSAWQNTPATWTPDNSNHFGIPFYKSGSNWVCRDDSSRSWPQTLSDWPEDKYKGAGNVTDTTLATWVTNIHNTWIDKFDIKRKECKSSKPECCRYKTNFSVAFKELDSYEAKAVIIVLENVRSDSEMWALGDSRTGLAPHEFGHHLGAPDEYGGVGTTQLGVSDSDGLSNGIDDDCIMGVNLTEPKRRHYKGICEVLALLVSDQYGKTYTYEAVVKAANLASPPGTPTVADSSGPSGTLIGAIIGGIVGAVAGAVIGFIASGGNPAGAVAGAAAGAVAGALIGAGIGSLF